MTNFGRQPMAPVFIDDVAALAADSLSDDAAIDQVFELGGPETMSHEGGHQARHHRRRRRVGRSCPGRRRS